MKKKPLRRGYTTGACAAAAAKAAALVVLRHLHSGASAEAIKAVEISFPDGSLVSFRVHDAHIMDNESVPAARASVIKDAGDDPDVTNGAEIVAEARVTEGSSKEEGSIVINGGTGVGIVTKPGLAVPVGQPAINPVPREMINAAVREAQAESFAKGGSPPQSLEVVISVTDGEAIAKKTLNARLGIVGGISILGTTGIVTPLSTEAWTSTITASMDVALAMGRKEIVLSAGRASEKAHMRRFSHPEESYVMMGDYLELALREAASRHFSTIHLVAQWAKMLKIALATPQTHVKHGVLDTEKAVSVLNDLGIPVPGDLSFNTAREIFEFLRQSDGGAFTTYMRTVCAAARRYAETFTEGIPVISHVVSYEGEILASSG